ncbi:hypothetical protein G3I01_08830 [Gramella sp. MT6]|uniref:relaxase/mobilization nuclease domain-containing protein n=1 Tax=Gramella sp. MT6 TaxID=2705471 RepID=UPI001C5E69AC|nr:relaxase/mobilization nuclease domain-containing protein [Gramella sp. MT6]QYA25611.1 hypothetical protein G3I01_08830 [Gramella sp. MT6]
MIVKLESISYGKNALAYCERGGEVLYTNKCLGNSSQLYEQMKFQARFNDRCIKRFFHIKIRQAPEDKGKLTKQDWIDICKDYAKTIGFEANLYAVYIHQSKTGMEHSHIVASRIGENNLAVRDDHTHYKNMDVSREIEARYNLRKVNRRLEKFKAQEKFISTDAKVQDLKEEIFAAIKMSDSMEDLIFHLENREIKTKIGRGISFTKNGIRKKGSHIDRKFSLKGIEKILRYKEQEKRFNKGISW